MPASYLFNSDGLTALASYIAPDTLFAFDLDGTLAPIVENFAAARVDESMRAILEQMAKLANVVVITGRSRKDAFAILGFEPHLLIGNHGAEWPPHPSDRNWQFVDTCLQWRDRLHFMLGDVQGVAIEFKGESISLHYRKAVDQEGTLTQIDTAVENLEPAPKRFGGKYVVNLVPMAASTKGEALVAAMNHLDLQRAIFIGDDVTDEEVFRMKDVDVFGIHVGKDGHTAAPYYLKKQSALLGRLKSMVRILETHKENANLWKTDTP